MLALPHRDRSSQTALSSVPHPDYLLLPEERPTTGDALQIAAETVGRLLTASELLQLRDLYSPSCCEEWHLTMELAIDEVIESSSEA